MTKTISAVYENGVLRPLEKLDLTENAQVRVTVTEVERHDTETEPAESETADDPLEGLRMNLGPPDFSEHFDDYRFGRRKL
ncbi:MAG: antitoxin family protein [Planctomycetaceae bacterium]